MKHLNSYNFVIPVLLSFVFFSCSDLGDSEVMGCTNPTACNYDSNATEDDGTCGTPDEVCDYCLDGQVIDGDDDNYGICNDDIVPGCTEQTACNYNASATEDDGSCLELDACGECGGDSSTCVSYLTDIQPIFNSNCTGCHGSSGGLNLSSYSSLIMDGGNSGDVVEPGNHLSSYLWELVDDGTMPPGNNPDLSSDQVSLIAQWINEGAHNN